MDCFAALAMTERFLRHCEERSDEAIHSFCSGMDCFAALAMTERRGLLRGARRARIRATRCLAMTGRAALTPSLPATNAKRLRKGAQRRSNPFFLFVEAMDCFAALAM